MKRFSTYETPELLTLDSQTLSDAIRLEAIHRGIKPPVALPEAIKATEWAGYQTPANFVRVYCIGSQSSYGGANNSRYGYLTKEAAQKAIEGLVRIDSTYRKGNSVDILKADETPVIIEWLIGDSASTIKGAKLEEYAQDDTEYDKLVAECLKAVSDARQAAYDKSVRSTRRAEYLRLAGGDEETAKKFWAFSEKTEWPTE